ncbi:hypothetical protein APR04_005649 [Promicromonospora umidemergens]|nr:hypothetical protein [Promicromonospora umidemergens]
MASTGRPDRTRRAASTIAVENKRGVPVRSDGVPRRDHDVTDVHWAIGGAIDGFFQIGATPAPRGCGKVAECRRSSLTSLQLPQLSSLPGLSWRSRPTFNGGSASSCAKRSSPRVAQFSACVGTDNGFGTRTGSAPRRRSSSCCPRSATSAGCPTTPPTLTTPRSPWCTTPSSGCVCSTRTRSSARCTPRRSNRGRPGGSHRCSPTPTSPRGSWVVGFLGHFTLSVIIALLYASLFRLISAEDHLLMGNAGRTRALHDRWAHHHRRVPRRRPLRESG